MTLVVDSVETAMACCPGAIWRKSERANLFSTVLESGTQVWFMEWQVLREPWVIKALDEQD